MAPPAHRCEDLPLSKMAPAAALRERSRGSSRNKDGSEGGGDPCRAPALRCLPPISGRQLSRGGSCAANGSVERGGRAGSGPMGRRRRGQPAWGGGAGGAGAAGSAGRGGMRAAHGLCAALALLLLPAGGRALRDGDCEGECGRVRPAGTAGGGRSSPPSPAAWPVRRAVGPGRGAASGL